MENNTNAFCDIDELFLTVFQKKNPSIICDIRYEEQDDDIITDYSSTDEINKNLKSDQENSHFGWAAKKLRGDFPY